MKIFDIKNGIKAIYSEDSMGLIYVRSDYEGKVLSSIAGEDMLDKEINRIRTDLDQQHFFSKIQVSTDRPMRTLYFCTSYNCNLACTYCLTNGSVSCGREKNVLSEATIKKAVSWFTELSTKDTEREVVIYGGEPTLYPDMIRYIFDTVRFYENWSDKGLKPARFILCTNGIKIDDELAKFIKSSGIYPAVSFDGYPALHNQNRRTPTGEGSFSLSERGYRLLQKYGVDAGVTMALGSHTVGELPKIVSFLHEYFSPKTIAANSMLDFENNINSWMPDSKLLPSKLWETFMVCREKGIYLVKSIMDNRVKPFVERIPRIWGCTGTGARMGVLPDGNIVPCMALSHKYCAHIDTKPQIEDYCPNELRYSSPFQRIECQSCIAKNTCGGGCPAAAILGEQGNTVDKTNCMISRYFLTKMIELLWEELEIHGERLEKGYIVPTYQDRRRLYGNINVQNFNIDFQFIPSVN